MPSILTEMRIWKNQHTVYSDLKKSLKFLLNEVMMVRQRVIIPLTAEIRGIFWFTRSAITPLSPIDIGVKPAVSVMSKPNTLPLISLGMAIWSREVKKSKKIKKNLTY